MPEAGTERRASWLSFLLTSFMALVVVGAVLAVLLQVAAVFVAAFLMLFLFCAFHYFVWGWWLSPLIHEEVEAEGRDAERNVTP